MGADNKPTNPAEQEKNTPQHDQRDDPSQPQRGDQENRNIDRKPGEHERQQRDLRG